MAHQDHPPGEVLEGNIAAWFSEQALAGVNRPYIWPGSWPDQDLAYMGRELAKDAYSVFDGAIIYFEAWDPGITRAVEHWNQDQSRWHARVIHRAGIWHPPRDLILITDRRRSDQVILSMWLGLGERS